MQVDLSARWPLAVIDMRELPVLLFEYFPATSIPGGSQTATYQNALGHRLAIRFGRDGRAVSVVADGTPQSVLREIETRIQNELVEVHTTGVSRELIFLKFDLTRSWRCGTALAVAPAPEEMPRVSYADADTPAVLELGVALSTNRQVNSVRVARYAQEASYLLNVLFEGGVRQQDRSMSYAWVTELNVEHGTLSNRWAQLGYHSSGLDPDGEGFLADRYEPLPLVSDSEYFSRIGLGSNADFELPEEIDRLVIAFDALSAENRACFNRACYWYRKGNDAWVVSRSLAFVALVSAIEALIDEPKAGGTTCEACGKATGAGPTAAFRSILEHLVPGPHSGKFRSDLYRRRSKLAHGDRLLAADEPGYGAGLSPASADEYWSWVELRAIVRLALVNYLRIASGELPMLEFAVTSPKVHFRTAGFIPEVPPDMLGS